MTVAAIPTPALVIDAAALQRNLRAMAAFFATGPCRLRPHVKAHKTPEIARRQLAAGSCVGLTCATAAEVEAVAPLCDDILLANEVVTPATAARLAQAIGCMPVSRDGGRRLTVAVDSRAGIDVLHAAASAAGVVFDVLIDINVGQNRCGVSTVEQAVMLARAIGAAGSLRLRGVMGYEGHLQTVRDRQAREQETVRAMTGLVAMATSLRQQGHACEVVSSGGTGTYDISSRIDGVTEIQAGSYALMDTEYAGAGAAFEQAFWILGTVISRPAADRCVADCGHKSATRDHGLPAVAGIAGATVTALNDEHAVIALPATASVQIGDRVRLVPSHVDPTVNLHDLFYVVDGDEVIETWEIAARGYPVRR